MELHQWMKRVCAVALAGLTFSGCLTSIQAQGLVPNHDFEQDGNTDNEPDDWFHGGSFGYPTDDSDGVGTRSASLTANGSDWRSLGFQVTPGESITWSVDYKVLSGSTGSIRADLRFFNFAGPGGTFGPFQGEDNKSIDDLSTVVPDVWHTHGPFTYNVPVTASPTSFGDVRLSAGLFGAAFNGTILFDKVLVTRIPEPHCLALFTFCALGFACRRNR